MYHQNYNNISVISVLPCLKEPCDEDCEANGLQDVSIVLQQCLSTASHPQVLVLGLMLIVEVGRVVGNLMLDAGPRGVDVAAAERDSIHQVFPLYITPQST